MWLWNVCRCCTQLMSCFTITYFVALNNHSSLGTQGKVLGESFSIFLLPQFNESDCLKIIQWVLWSNGDLVPGLSNPITSPIFLVDIGHYRFYQLFQSCLLSASRIPSNDCAVTEFWRLKSIDLARAATQLTYLIQLHGLSSPATLHQIYQKDISRSLNYILLVNDRIVFYYSKRSSQDVTTH